MAKLERYRLYELPEDKIREDTKQHRCHFDDCWKTAIPLSDFCLKHIRHQTNQFIYRDENDEESETVIDLLEITNGTDETGSVPDRKRNWTQFSERIDLQHIRQKIIRTVPPRLG